ncbi:hypothetical protein ZEAMMB73_Zm00001d009711 [Zea mays]|uniref:Uncharacterized protein n=1 Tax=Zea mays TaxID=4577 RepID=K7VTI1_MAIZE|nr:hypothetical protein ZEAMMB73_Zm00001d009711 [Zea mays]
MQMVGWSHDDSVVTGQHREALQYNGMIDAFRKTVRHEGVGALYKGLVLNSVKVVPSIAIAFVLYEVCEGCASSRDGDIRLRKRGYYFCRFRGFLFL